MRAQGAPTAFATSDDGVLLVTDGSHDTIDAAAGAFQSGEAFVAATPCGSNSAPPPARLRDSLPSSEG